MNDIDWKRIGWKITVKLVYYAIVVLVLSVMLTAGFSLMTVASTLSVAAGLVLVAVTFGAGITILLREILYYCSHHFIPSKKQKENEE